MACSMPSKNSRTSNRWRACSPCVGGGGGGRLKITSAIQAPRYTGLVRVVADVDASVAAEVTAALTIPTISVGAGPECDGQLMVWTDWAGFTTGRIPKFVKQYAKIGEILLEAAKTYRQQMESGVYPGHEHEYTDS